MKKWWQSIAIVALVFFAFPQTALAQTEFTTAVETIYHIDEQGSTTVTKNFELTNLTKDTYVTKYALKLSNFLLENIGASNENQPITPYVTKSDENTTISLNFPNTVVGEGQVRRFSISYSSDVFATLNASVLELNLPGQSAEGDENHIIHVEVPIKFGAPYRADPNFDATQQIGNFQRFTFKNTQAQSILLVFGKQQAYQMDIKYELTNTSHRNQQLTIPLPPDTPYQRVMYDRLEPKPLKISIDRDGNWLALYNLPAKQTSIITTALKVEVYLEPWKPTLMILPQAEHLAEDEYWRLTPELITRLINTPIGPQGIYRAVMTNLDYTKLTLDESRKRLGATGSLDDPKNAVCQEFADLFVALSRSQNIPARRAVGFAYSNQEELRPSSFEGDILHTWPEYYDAPTGLWRAVDPTWEDTTGGIDYFNHFDLSHIVFVYNGISSVQPYPPGSYQQNYSRKKTISVNTLKEIEFADGAINLKFEPTQILSLALPIYHVILDNPTGQAWYNLVVQTSSPDQNIGIKWFKTDYPTSILPFDQRDQALVLTTTELKPKTAQVTFKINLDPEFNYEKTFTVIAIPEIWLKPWFYWLVASIAASIALIIGSLLVLRRKRQGTLRRKSQEPTETYQQLLSH